MILKKFKIYTKGRDKYFKVIIYDSLQSMMVDANKFDSKTHRETDYDNKAYGLFQPFEAIRVFKDGREESDPEKGILRLAKNWCTTEVVCHELVHAAMWFYRLDHDYKADFGDSNSDDGEEVFAYIYDHFMRKVTMALYRHKIWG